MLSLLWAILTIKKGWFRILGEILLRRIYLKLNGYKSTWLQIITEWLTNANCGVNLWRQANIIIAFLSKFMLDAFRVWEEGEKCKEQVHVTNV